MFAIICTQDDNHCLRRLLTQQEQADWWKLLGGCRNDGSCPDAQHQVGCSMLCICLFPLQSVCWLHHHSAQHAWMVVSHFSFCPSSLCPSCLPFFVSCKLTVDIDCCFSSRIRLRCYMSVYTTTAPCCLCLGACSIVLHVQCKGAAAFCKASKTTFKPRGWIQSICELQASLQSLPHDLFAFTLQANVGHVSATKPHMQHLRCLIIHTLCLQDLVFLHQPYLLDSVWPDHQSSRQLGHAVYATKWGAATCLWGCLDIVWLPVSTFFLLSTA